MKIAILGSRGIPNAYGGFEQYAELLSEFLVRQGCEVHVYCSSAHPYQEQQLNKVYLNHQFDPEQWIGTAGQFIYDFNCIRDARSKDFDIIYQLGYTSSAIFNWMMPKGAKLVTNMDGFEWQRSKYSRWVQRFLKWSEGIVVRRSDFLIADALPIKDYFKKHYDAEAFYSAYIATPPGRTDPNLLREYNLEKENYSLLIARMEPENNIELTIEAFLASGLQQPLVVVGHINKYGRQLQKKFNHPLIRFVGPIYNKQVLDTLRQGARYYFHGHSVGGTNPSLLEAMVCGCRILAHDNKFNRSVLLDNALFFASAAELKALLLAGEAHSAFFGQAIEANLSRIRHNYSEATVFEPLYELFCSVVVHKHRTIPFRRNVDVVPPDTHSLV